MAGETVTLAYTQWVLVVLDLEESRVSGSGGVNRITGTFAPSESELRFGPLATTDLAGPEEAVRREQAVVQALATVTSYELEGRTLTLLADGRPVVRLAC